MFEQTQDLPTPLESGREDVLDAQDRKFGQTFRAVLENETSIGAIPRFIEGMAEFDYDPEFDPSDEGVVQEVAERYQVPNEYLENFALALSPSHMDRIGSRIREELDNEEIIQNSGAAGGIRARLLYSMADPVALVTTLGTGGTAGYLQAGKRLAALRGALAAAGSTAVYESLRTSQMETQGAEDVAYATAGAFLLGGLAGSFGASLHPAERGRLAQSLRKGMQEIESGLQGSSSAGAARVIEGDDTVPQTARTIQADAQDTSRAGGAPGFLRYLFPRLDDAGRFGASDDGVVRQLGQWVTRDHVAREGGAVTEFSAQEIKQVLNRGANSGLLRAYLPAVRGWARATNRNLNLLNENRTRAEFDRLVMRAVEAPEHLEGVAGSEHILRAADGLRQFFRRYYDEGSRDGLFENFKPNDRYLPHQWNPTKIRAQISRFGEEPLVEFFFRAAKRVQEAEDLDGLRKSIRRMVRTLASFDNGDLRRMSAQDIEGAKQVLLERIRKSSDDTGDDVSDELLEEIADTVLGVNKGDDPRLKRRVQLDTSVQMRMPDGSVLSFYDLMEDNVLGLAMGYGNSIGGRVAISRASQGKLKSDTDFGKFLQAVRDNADNQTRDKDAELLEAYYNNIVGRPLHGKVDENFEAFADFVSRYNFARLFGQTGFSATAEVGTLGATVGLRNLMQAVPEARKILDGATKGTIDDEVAHELSYLMGFGDNMLEARVSSVHDRMSDVGSGEEVANAKLQGPREFMRKASNVVSVMGGLGPVTAALQSMGARAAIARMAYRAERGKPLFSSPSRRASMGLSEADEAGIAELLGQITDVDNGFLGAANLKKFDTSRIETPEQQALLDKMILAVNRDITRAVQENSLGAMQRWMSHPVARIFLQFRNFALTSYTNHIQYGLSVRDFQSVMEFSQGMLFAGVGYAAQMHLRAAMSNEPEKYREDYLGLDKIALAAVYRSAHASLYPTLADFGAQALHMDPLFSHARSTGLTQDIIVGNPSAQLAVLAAEATGGNVAAAVNGDVDYSQEQVKDIFGMLPGGNTLPMLLLQNKIIQSTELPERSE